MKGLAFKAHFVPAGQKALAQVKWRRQTARIYTPSGKVVFEMKGVEVPKGFSSLAAEIAAGQYLRKGSERSVRSMIERVVGSICGAGRRGGYFKTRADERQFREELSFLLVHQMASFNSPVWFNVGLKVAYGAKGEQPLWHYDLAKGQALLSRDSYSYPQSSACFILSVGDSLSEIYDLVKTEAQIFKFGSGTGTNFSSLRAKGERLGSGGQSSGLISFLKVLDVSAAAVKSGGSTRRAAKMALLDIDHPEVEAFIEWKANEEVKAKALLEAGYSGGMDGEAYSSVTGQNANLSVRVTDRFMKTVQNSGTWKFRPRTSGGPKLSNVRADVIWQKITQAAWECADPGLQFHDTIQTYNTCPSSGEIRASNPCSEYMFLDNTACNLASLNLAKFLSAEGSFRLDDFTHAVRLLIVAQDILVGMSGYPTKEVAKNSVEFRPLGLGFANLGGALMRLGVAYDSEEARSWAGSVTALMSGAAHEVSAELAERMGAFKKYRVNRSSMLKVMDLHRRGLAKIPRAPIAFDIYQAARTVWERAIAAGKRYGYRNSQTTVIAPTGTIGLFMDCETTGIEPEFSLVKTKYLSGGGQLKFLNQAVGPALLKLGYSAAEVVKMLEHLTKVGSLEDSELLRVEDLPVFDCAQPVRLGGRSLSAEAHLNMMAVVQPFLSGAISKTVNLPSTATVQDVAKVYFRAWELGLKSIAIYRDQSKGIQPLVTSPKCSYCGGATVRSGACFKCLNCGHSESCG